MTSGKREFVVFGFISTYLALDAETLLDDMVIDVVAIPAPASISALCGLAMRVPADEAERSAQYLNNAEIPISAQVAMEDY